VPLLNPPPKSVEHSVPNHVFHYLCVPGTPVGFNIKVGYAIQIKIHATTKWLFQNNVANEA